MHMSHLGRYLLLLLIYFMTGFQSVLADSENHWSIVEISGMVEIRDASGQEISNAMAGTQLAVSTSVKTGADGRLVATHGKDTLTVGPDSQFSLPPAKKSDTGLITRIIQTFGSILYQVETRMNGGFEVETPYLVSVVKGTTFNVHVTEDTSTVALVEGRLWVHSPDAKLEVILEPGQAAIRSENSDKILLKDQQSMSVPVTGPIRLVDNNRSVTELRDNIGSGDLASGSRMETTTIGANTNDISSRLASSLNTDSNVVLDTSVDTGALRVDVDSSGITLDSSAISVSTAPTIDVGPVSVGVSETSLDLGDASVSLGRVPTVDLGDTSLDIGSVSIGDVSTPTVGIDSSISLDTGSGLNASAGIDIGDTTILDIDVSGTDVNLDVNVDDAVTTVTNTVSDTADAVTNTVTDVVDTGDNLLNKLGL